MCFLGTLITNAPMGCFQNLLNNSRDKDINAFWNRVHFSSALQIAAVWIYVIYCSQKQQFLFIKGLPATWKEVMED